MTEWRLEIQGGDQVQAALKKLGADAPQRMGKGLYDWAIGVMAISKRDYVPVDFGTLRASGHVQQPVIFGSRASVTLGYGGAAAPYAMYVHENPRSGKTGGVSPSGQRYRHWARRGEWKYLETPVKALAGRLRFYLARAISGAVKKAKRTGGFRFR